jgi:hypothetical protein
VLADIKGAAALASGVEKVDGSGGDIYPKKRPTLLIPDRPLSNLGAGIKDEFDLHTCRG